MATTLEARIALDTSAFDQALNKILASGKDAMNTLRQATQGLKIDFNTGNAGAQISGIANSFTAAKSAAGAATGELKNALAAMVVGGQKGTDEFKKLENELKQTVINASQLDDAMKQVDKAVEGLGGQKINLGEQLSEGLKGGLIGGLIGGGVAGAVQSGLSAISDGFSKVIEIGSEFQTNLQSVSAVTGVTGAGLDDIGTRAQGLAAKFGGGASEQLGVFQTALSKIGPQLAGSSTDLTTFADNVNTLSKTDSALGAAGAVDALSGALLQFGVNVNDTAEVARESTRFMNVLAASAGVGSASVADVAAAVAVSGSSMANANVSFEEGNAALQVLASKSLVGSQAGTALTAVLNKLQAASGPAADQLVKMGTSSEKLGELLTTKGIGAAMDELRTAMGNLGGTAEKNAFLVSLFGETGLNAAAALLGGGDMLREFTEGVTGTQAATEQAATNMATFSESMNRIGAQISNVAISIFQVFEPALSFIANVGATIFDGLISAISFVVEKLSFLKPVFVAIVGLLGYAAIQALITASSNFILSSSFVVLEAISAALTTTFASMWAALTGPVAIVIGAIAAIGAGLYLLYQNVEPFRNAIDGAFSFIKEVGSQVADVFSEIWDAISVVGDLIVTGIVVYFKLWWAVLQPIGEAIFSVISSLFSFNDAGAKTGGVMEFLTGVFDKIKFAIQLVKASIAGVTAAFDTVVSTVQNVVKAAANFSLSGIVDAFKKGGTDAANAFNEGAAESLTQDIFDNAAKNAERAFEKGVEINARIKTVADIGELQKTLNDAQTKLEPIQAKISRNETLTAEEQKSFDELTKKAAEASNKIKDIAPDAVAGVKTIISANGELTSVYEFNNQKLNEVAATSKKTFGAELQADQKKYSDSVLQASGAFEAQKKQLASVKAELDKTNDPKKAAELQDKYKELSANVETSGKKVNALFADGAKNELLTADAAAKLEKQLGFAAGTAARLAPSFKEPTERATELINALNKQVTIAVKAETDATAVTTLSADLEGIQSKLQPLQLKVESGAALTADEQKQYDELSAKAGEVSAKIKKIAPDAATSSKEVVTSTGKVIQIYDVSKDKVTEFADNAKKAGEQTKTALSGSFTAGFTQLGAELEKQKAKIANLKAQIAAAPEGAKKNELQLELEKTQNQATATGNAMKKALLDGKNAGLETKGAIVQIEKSFGLAAGQGDVLLQNLKAQSEQAKLAAVDVAAIGAAFAQAGKDAAAAQGASRAAAGGAKQAIIDLQSGAKTVAALNKEFNLGVDDNDVKGAISRLEQINAQQIAEQKKASKEIVALKRVEAQNNTDNQKQQAVATAKAEENLKKEKIKQQERADNEAAETLFRNGTISAERLEQEKVKIKAIADKQRLQLELKTAEAERALKKDTFINKSEVTEAETRITTLQNSINNTVEDGNKKIQEIEAKSLEKRFTEQQKFFADNAAKQVTAAQGAVKLIEAQNSISAAAEIERLKQLNSAKIDLITAESLKEIEEIISKNDAVIEAEEKLKAALLGGDKDTISKAIADFAEARRFALGSDAAVAAAAETNKKIKAQNAASAIEIRDAEIAAIEDVNIRTRDIALAENEKTLAAQIAAAKGNRQKEYAAYVEFAKQKAAILEKYDEATATTGQKIVRESIKALTALEKGFTRTVSEEERKRTEEKKAELDKQGADFLESLKQGEIDYNTFLEKLNELDRQRAELDSGGDAASNIFRAINDSLTASLRGMADALKASSDKALQAAKDGYAARAELAQTAADLELDIEKARADGKVQLEKDLQDRLNKIRGNGEKDSTELKKQASDLQEKINIAHNEGRADDEKKLRAELGDTQKQIAGDTETTGDAITKAYTDLAASAALSLGEAVFAGKNFGEQAQIIAYNTLQGLVPIFVAQIFGSFFSTLGPILGPIATSAATGLLYGLVSLAKPKGAEGGAPEGVGGGYNKPRGATDTIPLWVAPDEAIINAPQSRRYRQTLIAINKGGNVLETLLQSTGTRELAALIREKFSVNEIAQLAGMPNMPSIVEIQSMQEKRQAAAVIHAVPQRAIEAGRTMVIERQVYAERQYESAGGADKEAIAEVRDEIRALRKETYNISKKPVALQGGKLTADANKIQGTFTQIQKRNISRL